MDPTSFGIVKGEVQRLPFKDDKVKAIAYAQGNFYAEQVGELMREFSFDDGRLKALQACVGKMLPATCAGLIPLLRAFNFDNNKVSALELVSVKVVDPLNFLVLNDVFPYINERERVRNIMQRRATMVPPQPPPPVNPAVAGNPYPYGRPNPTVDPSDPVFRVADKAVTGAFNIVEGACGALFGRPAQRGAVVQRPVAYQTTTYVSPPGGGVQVVSVPRGATVTTIPPAAPYPQQAYRPAGPYPVSQAPPPYQPQPGYPAPPRYYK